MELDINNNKRDIDKFSLELLELMDDFKNHKETAVKDTLDQAAQLQLEVMTSQLESKDIYEKLNLLMKGFKETDNVIKDKFEAFLKDSSSSKEVEEERKKKTDEAVDGKIQNAFEQLRTDNLYIWKQSLEMAQKEFSEKGVGETMNFLPKTLLDRNDLKRTVNSLILDESTIPNPILKQNAPP